MVRKVAEDLSFMNWGFAPSKGEGFLLQVAHSEYADINLDTPIMGSMEDLLGTMTRDLSLHTNYWDDAVHRYGEAELTIQAHKAWDKITTFLNQPIDDIKRAITKDGIGYQGISNFDGYEWDLYVGFRGGYGSGWILVSMFNTNDETMGATWKLTKI